MCGPRSRSTVILDPSEARVMTQAIDKDTALLNSEQRTVLDTLIVQLIADANA